MSKIFLFQYSDSGSVCEFKTYSCEIYLNVDDVDHELDYCDRIPNERNLM